MDDSRDPQGGSTRNDAAAAAYSDSSPKPRTHGTTRHVCATGDYSVQTWSVKCYNPLHVLGHYEKFVGQHSSHSQMDRRHLDTRDGHP